jgi:dipeptidyl aminopeptidase/acylaminoacyl peptidase
MRTATIAILLAACGGPRAPDATAPKPSEAAGPAAALPAYASAEAMTRPRLFAPGAVSTADPEFATSFAADGANVYFDRANADRSKLVIMSSTYAGGVWQPAARLPFSTGEFRDVDPFVAGERLYFSSNRPRPGETATDFDTWYVTRTGSTWSEPVHVDGAPSGPGNQVFVTVARDGTLYFQSDASGGGDIYRAPRAGDAYPAAAALDGICTPASESNPAISPDGTLLVFVSDREGGVGGADLYASRARDGAWSPPKNLGPAINSPQADFAPGFSPDGMYLFFTSERPGVAPAPSSGRPPGDIYQLDVAALGI